MNNNKLSKQSITIAYEQRIRRRAEAWNVIADNNWGLDYFRSPYKSPVTYLRHRRGITWKEYFPAWGGTMYTSYGIEYKPNK